MRFESRDKKQFSNPNNWPKKDDEKNDQVYIALWDYVIGQLFSDTAESVQDLIMTAVSNMSKVQNASEF